MSDDSQILLGVPDTNGNYTVNLGQPLTKKKKKIIIYILNQDKHLIWSACGQGK